MEIVIFLGFIAVIGFGALMAVVLFGTGKADKKLASNSGEITRKLFDGRSQVTYTRGVTGLSDDVLLRAADRYGYDLTGRDTGRWDTTLTFTKR